MCKSPNGGKALCVENVKGSRYPFVTNIFGSFKRMCSALQIDHLDAVGERIDELLNQAPPKSLMKNRPCCPPKLLDFSQYLPKTVKTAPCQEVIERDNPDLSKFPILKTWPHDGQPTDEGRFNHIPDGLY